MNWLRQTKEPLFPDVLWSRPENRRQAGKLLIIGGHSQSFNAVSEAYSSAVKAGAGTTRVILPEKLRKMVSGLFPEAEFAQSNQIGSFGRDALGTLLDAADWSDSVLLAGEFGRNSETAILLDSFLEKYQGLLALAGDTLDYFLKDSRRLLSRKNSLLIGDLAQLQKIAAPALIQQNADFIKVVEQLSNWVSQTDLCVITNHSNQLLVSYRDQVSSTPVKSNTNIEVLAAYASVWWLQQPEKAFDTLTTAVYCLNQA